MATQQGAANAEAARVSGRMSNPNVYTPYGSQTVTWGGAGGTTGTPGTQGYYETATSPSGQPYQQWVDGTAGTPGTPGTGDPDQATIRQTLTPAGEQTVKEQQNAELNLSRIANAIVSNEGAGGFKNTLLSPFSFGGTPQQSLNMSNVGTATDFSPASGFLQTAGPDYGQIRNAPDLQGMGSAQGAQNTGQAISGVQAPNLQKSLDLNGVMNVSGGLNESNIAGMPINAGTTAQQAIMSRLQPQIAQNRVSEETKLTNQGLRPGGEAYDNAIKLLGQQENDQLTQAALQGLNLDMNANQQGFGQALSRGQFGNQAQQQQFGQRVQAGEFGNDAQLASFGAGLQNIDQINRATGQNFGQNLAATDSRNQALAQNQQTALAEQQAANQAQAQGFGNTRALQGERNAATQQNFQNVTAYQQNQNAAQQQRYGQQLQAAQFGNAAQQQALAQALQQRQVPFNEIAALLSGSQIQNPQFQAFQGQQVAPAPVMQAGQSQAAWNQNIYNQEVAQRNALTQGLFSLGGAATGMFGFGGR